MPKSALPGERSSKRPRPASPAPRFPHRVRRPRPPPPTPPNDNASSNSPTSARRRRPKEPAGWRSPRTRSRPAPPSRSLEKGGNACDAALAASITQTVVEPHMTTITGCLSQLYFDQATGETTYVNGNVNTPMAPLPGYGAHDLATGRGVAVPGWWGGFEAAHDRHASLPRKGN